MKNHSKALSDLPNIGESLAKKLNRIGIENEDQLKNEGTENTFIKLQTIDKDACINSLYALEGAIQGIRWHKLSKVRKEELLAFYNTL